MSRPRKDSPELGLGLSRQSWGRLTEMERSLEKATPSSLESLADEILAAHPPPVERDEAGNRLPSPILSERQLRRKRETDILCGDKRGVARMEQSWAKQYRKEAA